MNSSSRIPPRPSLILRSIKSGERSSAFDLLLHRAQLAQGVEVEIAAIDEAGEFVEQPAAELERTGDRPRAQQRRSLPGLPEALVEARARFRAE